MGIRAVLFNTDGRQELIELNSFTDLKERLGGGLAELVTTDSNGIMTWANEEAHLKNMPKNEAVSFNNGFTEQPLFGPVVSVREDELDELPYRVGEE